MSLKRTTRSATGSLPEAAVRFESEVWIPGSNNAYTKGREIDPPDFGYDPTGRGDPGFQPHGVGKLPTCAEIEEDRHLRVEEDAVEPHCYDSDYEDEAEDEAEDEVHDAMDSDYEDEESEAEDEVDDAMDSDYEDEEADSDAEDEEADSDAEDDCDTSDEDDLGEYETITTTTTTTTTRTVRKKARSGTRLRRRTRRC